MLKTFAPRLKLTGKYLIESNSFDPYNDLEFLGY